MIALLAAPTNLGLRPPVPGGVPGTSKAPEALREAGLHNRFLALGARDAGTVLAARYVDDDATRSPRRARNQDAMIDHAHRLADRIDRILAAGDAPLVLGGDCSLLLAAGIARGMPAQRGLVHIDGHTDFRHPGGEEPCASVGGEALAAAVGLHWPSLSDIDGRGPYFESSRVAHIGCRDDDEDRTEVSATIGQLVSAREVMDGGAAAAASAALDIADHDGFWLQIDVDVLDPRFMPAVDSPDPGGLTPEQLIELLSLLAPRALGAAVTIFDPDLDPDGRHAELLSEILVEGLGTLGEARTGAAA